MALTNKKIFGLDVNRYLADAKDADASLRNIGIEPRDLAIIFGASSVPTTSNGSLGDDVPIPTFPSCVNLTFSINDPEAVPSGKSIVISPGIFSAGHFNSTFLLTIFKTPPLFRPGESG